MASTVFLSPRNANNYTINNANLTQQSYGKLSAQQSYSGPIRRTENQKLEYSNTKKECCQEPTYDPVLKDESDPNNLGASTYYFTKQLH